MTTQQQQVLHILRHWLAVDVMGVREMTPAEAHRRNRRLQHDGELCRWVKDVKQVSFDKWIQTI